MATVAIGLILRLQVTNAGPAMPDFLVQWHDL